MQQIADILKKFNPVSDKYISREFQAFGVHLAKKLADERRKSLYIKLSKTVPRAILEECLRFVIDSNARNKAALFMWKLKQLKTMKSVPKSALTKIKPASITSEPNMQRI